MFLKLKCDVVKNQQNFISIKTETGKFNNYQTLRIDLRRVDCKTWPLLNALCYLSFTSSCTHLVVTYTSNSRTKENKEFTSNTSL